MFHTDQQSGSLPFLCLSFSPHIRQPFCKIVIQILYFDFHRLLLCPCGNFPIVHLYCDIVPKVLQVFARSLIEGIEFFLQGDYLGSLCDCFVVPNSLHFGP
jgi:hypothetical protein